MAEVRVRELKEANDKLFCLNAEGTIDMRWWRAAPFALEWASKISAKLRAEQNFIGTDKLFGSENLGVHSRKC